MQHITFVLIIWPNLFQFKEVCCIAFFLTRLSVEYLCNLCKLLLGTFLIQLEKWGPIMLKFLKCYLIYFLKFSLKAPKIPYLKNSFFKTQICRVGSKYWCLMIHTGSRVWTNWTHRQVGKANRSTDNHTQKKVAKLGIRKSNGTKERKQTGERMYKTRAKHTSQNRPGTSSGNQGEIKGKQDKIKTRE